MLSKKQQWRIVCRRKSTHSCAKQHDTDRAWAEEGHAPAGLVRAFLESLDPRIEEGSEDGSDTGGSDDDSSSLRSSRSVSFDETARVMLVPTRHELLALGRHGDGEGGDAGGGDAPREEGLWWTRKDCNKFRRSFRRQIFAQGLQKSCTTLLMGDTLVYKIGRDEENAEEEAGGGDGDAGAGADAGAGGDGRSSGSCRTSCGGAEVPSSPSPILAAVVQDFV